MKILQSDNGSEFVNQAVRKMTELYGVDHRLITAYHASSDGLVENRNKQVGRILKKLMAGSTGYWSDWLPAIQLALNTLVSERHKSSAFALMFGRAFNEFVDFSGTTALDNVQEAMDGRVEFWDRYQQTILPAVQEVSASYKTQQRTKVDKAHK